MVEEDESAEEGAGEETEASEDDSEEPGSEEQGDTVDEDSEADDANPEADATSERTDSGDDGLQAGRRPTSDSIALEEERVRAGSAGSLLFGLLSIKGRKSLVLLPYNGPSILGAGSNCPWPDRRRHTRASREDTRLSSASRHRSHRRRRPSPPLAISHSRRVPHPARSAGTLRAGVLGRLPGLHS